MQSQNKLHHSKEGDNVEKLKPCPFCGNDTVRAIITETDYAYEGEEIDGDVSIYINCYDCGIECVPCESGDKAIEAWNNRA